MTRRKATTPKEGWKGRGRGEPQGGRGREGGNEPRPAREITLQAKPHPPSDADANTQSSRHEGTPDQVPAVLPKESDGNAELGRGARPTCQHVKKTTKGPLPQNTNLNPSKRRGIGQARPLSRALQKVWVFRFVDPGPGASGGPRKVPLGYPWAFPGPPGAPGTQDKPKQKTQKPKRLD